MSDSLSRRQFLGTTAAAGVLLAGQIGARPLAAAEDEAWPKLPPVKIYKVYVGRTGGIYLSRPTEEIEKFEKYLADVEKKLGDVKFIGGDLVPPAEVDQVRRQAQRGRRRDAVPSVAATAATRPVPGQAHRRRTADGRLLAALQRPRLDVLPRLAEGRARRSSCCRPATGASWTAWWG